MSGHDEQAEVGGVEIVEVAPRDGFQSIREPIPTGQKIAIIEALIAAGIRRMEIGSFVNPKAVPQMQDMGEIAAHFRGRPNLGLSVLVPNAKGAERARESGFGNLVYVFSVSEAHNQSNVRQSVEQSLQQLREIVAAMSGDTEFRLRIDLATAFDCPFAGTVALDQLRRAFAAALEICAKAEIALCDTTGRAGPYDVRRRFQAVMADAPGHSRLAFHGHDTFGMGVANALFAHSCGVSVFDAAAAGLGGCPFAPGATGNTATEDLHFAFEDGGISTRVDRAKLLDVADRIAALPGGKSGGHLRIVPRARALAGAPHSPAAN